MSITKAIAVVVVWLLTSSVFATPHGFQNTSPARKYARRMSNYHLNKRDDCDGTSCPDGCYQGTNDVCCSGGGAVDAGDICCNDSAGGGCAIGLTCGFCDGDGVCCSDKSCSVLVNTNGVSSTVTGTACSPGSTQPTVPPVTTPPPVTPPAVTPPPVSVNPHNLTCGWINGNSSDPYTCQPHSTCVVNDEFNAFACCDSKGSCDFRTACVYNGNPVCLSSKSGDCYHFDWTIDCIGNAAHCVYNTMPPKTTSSGGSGTVSGSSSSVTGYISARCQRNTDTTTVLPVFTGGPTYSQYPIEYSDLLASISPSKTS
ncbi:uncharacterized protein Z520_01679 [Fonsecaea multimorphosa CBS 102226]|uniref:Uncharacterized protein n=1 Tax=Fonsecaea multimorphosa CBS 102226 TaxID=1442371 RepID=A0A0D2J1E2_9EURO|nr:uncharacterized protein Z520_01679 [Fonsecaea multimorphosa CBS 102226]KIY03212.1 hypothetical protein Z520_01679 [Fonsecaea multimorphosa CBS 102226]